MDFYINFIKIAKRLSLLIISCALLTGIATAAPVVKNRIPDQIIYSGDQLNLTISTYEIFEDTDNLDLSISIEPADDNSNLPDWLVVEPKQYFEINKIGDIPFENVGSAIISGNHLYRTDDKDLITVDISNPHKPNFKGKFQSKTHINTFQISSDYAYTINGQYLTVININDPAKLAAVTQLAPFGSSSIALFALGENSGFITYSTTMYIIDINNPINPTFKSINSIGSSIRSAAVSDEYAYAIANQHSSKLRIANLNDTSTSSFTLDKQAHSTCPSSATIIVAFENYIYLLCSNNSFKIMDINDPLNPQLAGSFASSDFSPISGVAIVDNYAYLLTGTDIQIIDIEDPSKPKFLGKTQILDENNLGGLLIKNNYAYIPNSANGTIILEGVGGGLQLYGEANSDRLETFDITITASNGDENVSTTFSINVIMSEEEKELIQKRKSHDQKYTNSILFHLPTAIATALIVIPTMIILQKCCLHKPNTMPTPPD